MISLSDHQLRTVMAAAGTLDLEKRDTFLRRVAATLLVRCGRYNDSDDATAAGQALASLIQHADSAA